MFLGWLGHNVTKKVDEKYAWDNMSQMEGGQHSSSIFFVDDMSGFGVDEQSVHFHVECSVTVNVVYMGRKIQWTIHSDRSVTRTRRTWTIHHSTQHLSNI
jgi:hypothetical protein